MPDVIRDGFGHVHSTAAGIIGANDTGYLAARFQAQSTPRIINNISFSWHLFREIDAATTRAWCALIMFEGDKLPPNIYDAETGDFQNGAQNNPTILYSIINPCWDSFSSGPAFFDCYPDFIIEAGRSIIVAVSLITTFIPSTVTQAFKPGTRTLNVFGGDYPLPAKKAGEYPKTDMEMGTEKSWR